MSNNIWADLGFDDPEGMLLKSDVLIEIQQAMSSAKLSKRQAAKRLGISAGQLNAILHVDIEDVDLAVLEGYRDILKGAVAQRG